MRWGSPLQFLIKHAPAKQFLSRALLDLLGPRAQVTLFYGLLTPVLQATTGSRNLHGGYFENSATDWHEAQENLTRFLAALCGFGPDHHLLEVGAGLGGAAATIARSCHCRVTGLNLSRPQVRNARTWIAQEGLARSVQFVQGDATDMPFRWALFHHAYAIESLSHIPDKDAVLQEVARVTLPGARFGVLDACAEDIDALHRDPDFAAFNAGWGVRSDGWCRLDSMQCAFERNGFTQLEVHDITPQVGPSARIQADYVRRRRTLLENAYGRAVLEIILNTLEITRRYVEQGLISYRLWIGRKPS